MTMDATWMAEALAEARKAAAEGEVPIGAVVVLETVGPIRGVLPTRRFLPALTKRSRPARGRAMHRPRREIEALPPGRPQSRLVLRSPAVLETFWRPSRHTSTVIVISARRAGSRAPGS